MNDDIKIEKATTEVRIGNNGFPMAYINTTNHQLVKKALEEFKKKMFDGPNIHFFMKIKGIPCILDSICVFNSVIYAWVDYPVDEYNVTRILEHVFRKGVLWLGADIEFDSRRPISANTLVYDDNTVQAMAVGEQMTRIEFKMLYAWDDENKRRETIFKPCV